MDMSSYSLLSSSGERDLSAAAGPPHPVILMNWYINTYRYILKIKASNREEGCMFSSVSDRNDFVLLLQPPAPLLLLLTLVIKTCAHVADVWNPDERCESFSIECLTLCMCVCLCLHLVPASPFSSFGSMFALSSLPIYLSFSMFSGTQRVRQDVYVSRSGKERDEMSITRFTCCPFRHPAVIVSHRMEWMIAIQWNKWSGEEDERSKRRSSVCSCFAFRIIREKNKRSTHIW